jgi:hypothetical protein
MDIFQTLPCSPAARKARRDEEKESRMLQAGTLHSKKRKEPYPLVLELIQVPNAEPAHCHDVSRLPRPNNNCACSIMNKIRRHDDIKKCVQCLFINITRSPFSYN